VRRQQRAELAERPGLFFHQRPAGAGQGAGVHARKLLAGDGGQGPVHHRLDQRAKRQAVTGGHEVDRPAHQRYPDHLPAHQQFGQIIRAKARQR
jgi:hypothetical protein